MASQAEVRDLIKHVRATGHKVVKSGREAHYKVLSPKGAKIVDQNGPLIISSSPSDNRFREMTVKRLLAAGVLEKDPYKKTSEGDDPSKNGKRGAHLQDPEVRERQRRALEQRSRRLLDMSMGLRSRVEPVIAKLGGWGTRSSMGVTTVQFADVVFFWATRDRRPELPETTTRGEPITVDHLRAAVSRLKATSETIPEKWMPLLGSFVSELERGAGEPPSPDKAASRYRELLRESRSLPQVEDDDDEVFAEGERNLHDHLANTTAKHNRSGQVPVAVSGLPMLAFELLYRINPDSTRWETALELATKVAALESVNEEGGKA